MSREWVRTALAFVGSALFFGALASAQTGMNITRAGNAGTVTGVSATAPLVSNGSTTNPTISCTAASASSSGCVTLTASNLVVDAGVVNVSTGFGFQSSAASGSNAFGATTNGARFDFGAGANDYCSSDGTIVTFNGPVNVVGAMVLDGGLSCVGNVFLDAGTTMLNGNLVVDGGTVLYGTLSVDGGVNVTGTLNISGTISGSAVSMGGNVAAGSFGGPAFNATTPTTNGYQLGGTVVLYNLATTLATYLAGGNVADSAGAIGVVISSGTTTQATAGAKLLSIRNNNIEKAYFDFNGALYADGGVYTAGTAAAGKLATTPTDGGTQIEYAPYVRGNVTTPQVIEQGRGTLTAGFLGVTFNTPFSASPTFCGCHSIGVTTSTGCDVPDAGPLGGAVFGATGLTGEIFWECRGPK